MLCHVKLPYLLTYFAIGYLLKPCITMYVMVKLS